MNKAVLLLGGNIGNVEKSFEQAITSINEECGKIILQSRTYKSEAWGFDSNSNFLNKAIIINTTLSAIELLKETQKIEISLGRERKSSTYESRKIDIDILFFNNEIIHLPELQIPHPKLHLRQFTLKCLLDIIPDYIHPIFKENITTIQKNCPDKSKVWLHQNS